MRIDTIPESHEEGIKINKLSFSIGIQTSGGLFLPLLIKGQNIPDQFMIDVTTLHDKQSNMQIKV